MALYILDFHIVRIRLGSPALLGMMCFERFDELLLCGTKNAMPPLLSERHFRIYSDTLGPKSVMLATTIVAYW